MNQNIQREVSEAGIAILTFDRPDSTANLFDERTLDELNGHLDFLEAEKGLKGLIIRSAKPKIFIAGADLNTFTLGNQRRADRGCDRARPENIRPNCPSPLPERCRDPWRCSGRRF